MLENEKSGEGVKTWGYEMESKFEKNGHDEAEKEEIRLRKRFEEELIIEGEKLKRRSGLTESYLEHHQLAVTES